MSSNDFDGPNRPAGGRGANEYLGGGRGAGAGGSGAQETGRHSAGRNGDGSRGGYARGNGKPGNGKPGSGNGKAGKYPEPEGWGDDGFWRDSGIDSDYETGLNGAVRTDGNGPRGNGGYSYWADDKGWQNTPGSGAGSRRGRQGRHAGRRDAGGLRRGSGRWVRRGR